MTFVRHLSEEAGKIEKLKREKPEAWEKMQDYPRKCAEGVPVPIIRLEPEYKCNFRCSHCSVSEFRLDVARRILTFEEIRGLYLQADSMGLARTVISGGEPLTYNSLSGIIAAINPARWYISIDTNGWLLTHEKAQWLKGLGVDRIQLSIDSLNPKDHDEFRRKPGSFQRCLNALSASQAAGLDIFVQTVVTKSRLYSKEFIQFLEYFNGRGVSVFVTYGKPVGEWKHKRDDLIGVEDIRWFEKELEPKYNCFTHLTGQYGREGRCIAVHGMINVTDIGDVLPCLYWYRPIGNIRKEPLKDIIERAAKAWPFCDTIKTCPIADRDWLEYFESH